MKKHSIALLAAFIVASPLALVAQSPSPSPTPAGAPARVSASEIVAQSAVGTTVAALPATETLPDGTVLALRGYQVLIISSGTNAGKAQVTASYTH